MHRYNLFHKPLGIAVYLFFGSFFTKPLVETLIRTIQGNVSVTEIVEGCLMGCVYYSIGIMVYVMARKRRNLLKIGRKIDAVVYRVKVDYGQSSNGNPAYKIHCTYEDETTGILHHFDSCEIWGNVDECVKVNDIIPVYVDQNDYSKYYIDLDAIFPDDQEYYT